MDTNTVQEIANQLGIGVDQILTYLPAYAQAKIMGFVIPMILGIIVVVISIIVFTISYKRYNKYDNLYYKEDEHDEKYHTLSGVYFTLCCIFGILGGLILIALLLIVPRSFEQIIGWSTCPELMFLKSLIPN